MAGKCLLALDQGTTSTRAIVFDARLAPRASAQVELKQFYPRPALTQCDRGGQSGPAATDYGDPGRTRFGHQTRTQVDQAKTELRTELTAAKTESAARADKLAADLTAARSSIDKAGSDLVALRTALAAIEQKQREIANNQIQNTYHLLDIGIERQISKRFAVTASLPFVIADRNQLYNPRGQYKVRGIGEYALGDAFLTISLSEPYAGSVHKLIAAVMPAGRARQGSGPRPDRGMRGLGARPRHPAVRPRWQPARRPGFSAAENVSGRAGRPAPFSPEFPARTAGANCSAATAGTWRSILPLPPGSTRK